MKCLKIEIPDRTLCAFLNYVFVGEDGGMNMGVKQISTEDIEAGHVTVETKEDE